MALRVKESLEAEGVSVVVFDYPQGSKALSLPDRGAKADGYDLFLSLHHNSGAGGYGETLIGKDYDAEDKAFAAAVQRNMALRVYPDKPSKNKGVKSQTLGVLKGAMPGTMAAALTEPYFMDESSLDLDSARARTALAAQGVAEGIIEYWLSR